MIERRRFRQFLSRFAFTGFNDIYEQQRHAPVRAVNRFSAFGSAL